MKILINLLLTLVVAGLGWVLYNSIAEPIQFGEEWRAREKKVSKKLEQVRTAQLAFKDIVGYYATSFDTLSTVLKSSNFEIKTIIGDPNAENADFKVITSYVPTLDSMTALGINLDSLQYIPYTDGKTFDIEAKVLPEYQNAKNIPVVMVSTVVGDYMGPWNNKKYNKYDQTYNPKAKLFFGNLGAPSTDGNWRKSL